MRPVAVTRDLGIVRKVEFSIKEKIRVFGIFLPRGCPRPCRETGSFRFRSASSVQDSLGCFSGLRLSARSN